MNTASREISWIGSKMLKKLRPGLCRILALQVHSSRALGDICWCSCAELKQTGSAADTFREAEDGLVRVNYLLFYLLSFITRL